jgi:hypothetical protein
VTLILSPQGNVKVSGDGAAVNRWLESITVHKLEIVKILKAESRADDGEAINGWRK